MTDNFGLVGSPAQHRTTDPMTNWASSPSPFGCEGLLSMEMGSPFQLFSPITYGTTELENSESASVFSPSMFSPSKSEFKVTSRLIKKRGICSSDLRPVNDAPGNDVYRAPTLVFGDSQQMFHGIKEDNYPQLRSSSPSIYRSSHTAPSSSFRQSADTAIAAAHVGDDEIVPEVTNRTGPRQGFFSPDTSSKATATANQISEVNLSRQGFGIADVRHLGKDIPKPLDKDRRAETEFIPPTARKLNRSETVDQNVLKTIQAYNNEDQAISYGKLKKVSEKPNDPRSLALAMRSTYASPSVSSLRDEPQNGYADSVMVTPSQCKCKKTKCLKLYCDCFALLRYCGPNCGCTECHNDPTHEEIRKAAIVATMQRTATAFTSKVTPTSSHVAGCNCSKSNCLKKYCECFLGGATCGASCKCQSCKNFPGSEALRAVRKPDNPSSQPLSGSKASKEQLNKPKYSQNTSQPMEIQFTQRDVSEQNSSASSPPLNLSQLSNSSDDDCMAMRRIQNPVEGGSTQWDAFKFSQVGPNSMSSKPKRNEMEAVQGKRAMEEENRRAITRSTLLKEHAHTGPPSLQPVSEFFTSITPSSTGVFAGSSEITGREKDSNDAMRRNDYSGSKAQLWGSQATPAPLLASNTSTPSSSFQSTNAQTVNNAVALPVKRRKMNETKIVYPYFGPTLPQAPKICALRCLEYLDGKDFYSASVLNHLWSKTAMDSALWE